MNTGQLAERLILFLVIALLPTLGCFGYYSATAVSDASPVLVFLLTMSYPAILVSILGLIRTLAQPGRSRLAIFLWSLCILAAVNVLAIWA